MSFVGSTVLPNTPALLSKAAVLLICAQNQRLQGACVNKVSQCVICQSLHFSICLRRVVRGSWAAQFDLAF